MSAMVSRNDAQNRIQNVLNELIHIFQEYMYLMTGNPDLGTKFLRDFISIEFQPWNPSLTGGQTSPVAEQLANRTTKGPKREAPNTEKSFRQQILAIMSNRSLDVNERQKLAETAYQNYKNSNGSTVFGRRFVWTTVVILGMILYFAAMQIQVSSLTSATFEYIQEKVDQKCSIPSANTGVSPEYAHFAGLKEPKERVTQAMIDEAEKILAVANATYHTAQQNLTLTNGEWFQTEGSFLLAKNATLSDLQESQANYTSRSRAARDAAADEVSYRARQVAKLTQIRGQFFCQAFDISKQAETWILGELPKYTAGAFVGSLFTQILEKALQPKGLQVTLGAFIASQVVGALTNDPLWILKLPLKVPINIASGFVYFLTTLYTCTYNLLLGTTPFLVSRLSSPNGTIRWLVGPRIAALTEAYEMYQVASVRPLPSVSETQTESPPRLQETLLAVTDEETETRAEQEARILRMWCSQNVVSQRRAKQEADEIRFALPDRRNCRGESRSPSRSGSRSRRR